MKVTKRAKIPARLVVLRWVLDSKDGMSFNELKSMKRPRPITATHIAKALSQLQSEGLVTKDQGRRGKWRAMRAPSESSLFTHHLRAFINVKTPGLVVEGDALDYSWLKADFPETEKCWLSLENDPEIWKAVDNLKSLIHSQMRNFCKLESAEKLDKFIHHKVVLLLPILGFSSYGLKQKILNLAPSAS